MLCSWWCCYGVTFLLFWLIRVVFRPIGDLLLMKNERKATRWTQWNLAFCIRSYRIKEFDTVENAITWNHHAAITVLFVSSKCLVLHIFPLSWRIGLLLLPIWVDIYVFHFGFQVDDAYWRWTIIVFGSLIVLGLWITNTSFCFWYVYSSPNWFFTFYLDIEIFFPMSGWCYFIINLLR